MSTVIHEQNCPFCWEPIHDTFFIVGCCNNKFHNDCIASYIDHSLMLRSNSKEIKVLCPLCRKVLLVYLKTTYYDIYKISIEYIDTFQATPEVMLMIMIAYIFFMISYSNYLISLVV
jgi:hypothetical protein